LAAIIPKIVGLFSSVLCKFLLMGVKFQVHYLVFTTNDEVDFLLLHNSREFSTSGARQALLMRVAPKAIVEFNYLSIG
jgi:hypothetical protein